MIVAATTVGIFTMITLVIDVIGVYPAPAAPNFKTLPAG